MSDSLPHDVQGERTPQEVLSRVFGFPAFRSLQEEAVRSVMQGEDVLVLMPTGGGKSLCYQVPALCRPGLGLVVSPLIALMDDQVAALRQVGVRAAALHSELDAEEQQQTRAELSAGTLEILYVSPERLLSPGTRDWLSRRKLSVIAVDEAHCVSAWGHEFRPEYRGLATLREIFPNVPRIALTATADPRTRDDILQALGMPEARVLTASFHRPNLVIGAQAKIGETRQLQDALAAHTGPGATGAVIVYCGSRAKTERIASSLHQRGITALPFHAGLSPMEKRAALMRFRGGEAMVIVATIAFGMGIDRPDVRCVVHLDMPGSPEAYYQQIGRGGRDGAEAETLLLYGGEDMARARYWLEQSNAPESEKRVMGQRLESMIALTETTGCRTQALLSCFGEVLAQNCGHCDNCRNPVVTFDGTEAAQKVLSAIYRTGQRFGAVHLTNVLLGKQEEAVLKFGHQHLSVFGLGRDRTSHFWRAVIRQLIARGAIRMEGEHGGLSLDTEVARPILRGETQVPLRQDSGATSSAKRAPSTRSASSERPPEIELDADGEARFQALRAWRLGEAREQAIPPYLIFYDSTLREIARDVPQNRNDLASVKGVGASKLERYSDAIMDVLGSVA